jgi:hypothetical protein
MDSQGGERKIRSGTRKGVDPVNLNFELQPGRLGRLWDGSGTGENSKSLGKMRFGTAGRVKRGVYPPSPHSSSSSRRFASLTNFDLTPGLLLLGCCSLDLDVLSAVIRGYPRQSAPFRGYPRLRFVGRRLPSLAFAGLRLQPSITVAR